MYDKNIFTAENDFDGNGCNYLSSFGDISNKRVTYIFLER